MKKKVVVLKKHTLPVDAPISGSKESRRELKKRGKNNTTESEIVLEEIDIIPKTMVRMETPIPLSEQKPSSIPTKSDQGVISKSLFDEFIGNLSGERLGRIRKELYANCGFSFPFSFDAETLTFTQQIKSWQQILKDDKSIKIKKISLDLGKFCFTDSIALVTVNKVNKETSQGQVSVVELRDEHEKSLFVVLKADEILQSNNIWSFDQQKKRTIHGEKQHEKYQIIGSSFCDGLICQFLSHRVEKEELPNFPLVYATTINQINNSYSQLLFMEYLPYSLFEVLKNEKDVRIWWSSLFQIIFALAFTGYNYGFIHNDCHAENIRTRLIDSQLVGNYIFIDGSNKEYCFKVSYYGLCACLIDCGRSVLKPFGLAKMGLISSEFLNGNCQGLVPDNPSFDMVRLTASLYAYTDRIQPVEDRVGIQNFIKSVCKTDDGTDYIKGFDGYNKMTAMEKYRWMETMPRQNMHNGNPIKLLPKFASLYGCLKEELKEPLFILDCHKSIPIQK